MAQRPKCEHFDMLPFIAVLMCTLGSLLYVTLIIAALCIGPGVGEGWIPVAGKGQPGKVPVLIEWDGTAAVVHRDGNKVRIAWDPQTSESPSSLLEETLADLERRRETHYALFAVRPSGFASIRTLTQVFREREIDVGSEPIGENRPVRLLAARTQS